MLGGQISPPVKGFKLTKFFWVRFSGVDESRNVISIVMMIITINMIIVIMTTIIMMIIMINMIIVIMT